MIARVVDVETTGLPDNPDAELVEVAFVDVDVTQPDFPLIYSTSMLIKPARPIPPETSAIHHIIDADVAEAGSAGEAVFTLFDKLHPDDVLVAHSAAFEQHFLPDAPQRWVDTLKCAYRAYGLMRRRIPTRCCATG